MEYAVDIDKFNLFIQKTRVYTFLDGLDDALDGVRAQIVQIRPFPNVQQAYGNVRREAIRQSVMIKGGAPNTLALATKGFRFQETRSYANKNYASPDKSRLKCSHCGGNKHTKDQCFELIGYPEWWKGKKKQSDRGKAYTIANSEFTGTNQCDSPCHQPGTVQTDGQHPGKALATSSMNGLRFQHLVGTQTAAGGSSSVNIQNQQKAASVTDKQVESGEESTGIFGNYGELGKNFSSSLVHFRSENKQISPEKLRNWVIDSGATDHMTFEKCDISENKPVTKGGILNANGDIYPVIGTGDIHLSEKMVLKNALVVPSLSTKLISVGKLTEELNCTVLMFPTHCIFQDTLTKETLGHGTRRGGLYYLEDLNCGKAFHVRNEKLKNKVWLWHRRLGHPSFGYMRKLLPHLFVGFNNEEFICETCVKAKSHRNNYPDSLNKSSSVFDIVHTDVWGPSPLMSKSGCRWYVLFTDDFSRMTWLYLLKGKNEVSQIIVDFYKMVKTQFGIGIKMFRSDNGTEFINHSIQTFFRENGVLHQTSCVGTPQQNGVAERKNRQILEITRALLFESKVPDIFWDNAATFAVYLMNRIPTKSNDFQTPLQKLSTQVSIPSILNLEPRIFGCSVYVHMQKTGRSKLEPFAEKCVFLGFSTSQKGYKCYNPTKRRFYITMDVFFLENEFYFMNQNLVQGESNGEPNSSVPTEFSFLSPSLFQIPDQVNLEPVLNLEPAPVRTTVGSSDSTEDRHTLAGADVSSSDRTKSDHVLEQTSDSQVQAGTDPSSAETEPSLLQGHGLGSNGESSSSMKFWIDRESEDEEVIQLPLEPRSPEGAPEVSIPEPRYNLPPRINRGRPPKQYIPEDGTSRAVKYPIVNFVKTEHLPKLLKTFSNQLSSVAIPEKLEDACENKNWVDAMNVEMEALEKNNTWELVNLPSGKKPVGCRWVYSIKYNAAGEIERYKARLVAKGYTQTYGIDFQETFSPVAKLNTIRVILSIAANLEWPLHQFDVKNAFLHGDLEEEIYMDIPPGFCHEEGEKKVCKLNKALYGLKQSPRAWFGRFRSAMKNYGYVQADSDHTLFFKRKGSKIVVLIIYVDDMIITGNDEEGMKELKLQLSREFEMKDLGGLKYFLGIEVSRSKKGIFLSQRKYILDLLSEVGMLECKPAETPMVQNLKLEIKSDQNPVDKERYQRLVGKLIYLSHTRPDIAYAVGVVSQFMHAPSDEHMDAVLRILRYLKGTPGKGIAFLKHGHLDVDGFTDADWAGNVLDRRSTAGYFTFVGGNLVTWRSKKQNVVALSSAEAEFRGMVKGVCELIWIKKVLTELGFENTKEMRLFCDNKAAIQISHNPVQHDRTKHIEIDRHFLKEKLDSKVITLPFVKSSEQAADILTKAVGGKEFQQAVSRIGMVDIFLPR